MSPANEATQNVKKAGASNLIVALDLPDAAAALAMVANLRGAVGMFKVGLELFTAEGSGFVRQLTFAGDSVFLDLKLHDIPNTVKSAAREAAKLGATFLDVHAAGGRKMMEAAMEGVRSEGADGARPKVLAVTILTSLSDDDLREIGFASKAEDMVLRLASLAQRAGLDGVVASPREAAAIRRECGPDFLIVTPGIRPAGADLQDQARAATPAGAIAAGANYLVVGRPITASPDPRQPAAAIAAEIAATHTNR
ncbi:MAG: orotidine-5'-phosphate decarboxylase [Terriglobia bacterium]